MTTLLIALDLTISFTTIFIAARLGYMLVKSMKRTREFERLMAERHRR